MKTARHALMVLFIIESLSACHLSDTLSNNQIDSNEKAVYSGRLTVEGQFQGKNLYVLNPEHLGGFCTDSVLLNGILLLDSSQVQISAYEIDLISLGLDTGAAVKIEIFHASDCMPKILNNEVRAPLVK